MRPLSNSALKLLKDLVRSLEQCFSTFSSRETFETIFSNWRNLDTQNSINMMILRELRKKLAVPLGSAESRLKNTALE